MPITASVPKLKPRFGAYVLLLQQTLKLKVAKPPHDTPECKRVGTERRGNKGGRCVSHIQLGPDLWVVACSRACLCLCFCLSCLMSFAWLIEASLVLTVGPISGLLWGDPCGLYNILLGADCSKLFCKPRSCGASPPPALKSTLVVVASLVSLRYQCVLLLSLCDCKLSQKTST